MLPLIAARTYQRLNSDLYYRKIAKIVKIRLKKIKNSFKRVKYFHEQIDLRVEDALEDEYSKKFIACKSGCSACCHTQIGITKDEAELLSDLIIDGHEVDLKKLYRQAKTENDSSRWYHLSYEQRGCVFLNTQKECTIYENRPAVCRTNNVIGDAANCDTKSGIELPVRLLKTEEADMVLMAAFLHSKENGALPYLLAKTLDKKLGIPIKELKDLSCSSDK